MTEPRTEAGKRLWESMTGGAAALVGTFQASARHLGAEIAAIEADAALPVSALDALRAALRDFVALLPPDRWPLLRPETIATVDAALAKQEAEPTAGSQEDVK